MRFVSYRDICRRRSAQLDRDTTRQDIGIEHLESYTSACPGSYISERPMIIEIVHVESYTSARPGRYVHIRIQVTPQGIIRGDRISGGT